ncbi:3-isopropylmalate/(R)-2-methylmalate dehydratase small subunit [Parafrankia irregularis]|uniref:3-isopropylmalate dehydratase small subunit n=1 Tax=Parafrankia irregularis TaxID=795642 RepID=A0A0S4QHH9_9ACTN|nr:3-isopropylmalate dehydratase small subunit [Parafrankia irregularis]MBE3204174.1 3-isopropylmalate dehydratase small subunit [Parafrankia sp. CH37]CUU54948.1 3-isopropylmalate/(R)-2-methylmalate dehydratase small subunit [Parafrankia irregularis]
MQALTVHTGTAMPLRRSDVDTDQIIPVRFLNRSSRTGHADSLFADWRQDPKFVFNRPEHHGATVLVAGRDFGTGSSREYAVWALQNYGFRVVLAPRFGDIFRENALLNGLVAIVLPAVVIEQLWTVVTAAPAAALTVDLLRQQVGWAGHRCRFEIDPRMRARILAGTDAIDDTMLHADLITSYEAGRRRLLPTTR